MLAVVTLLLLTIRERLDKVHITLVYLLVVLAGTLGGGRNLGLALAALSFLVFNWFFIPPYNTFAISNPLDWLVLLAFFSVSAVVAQILHRLRTEADAAGQRAAEVDRFATLGAEALKVARAEEALTEVAEVIRATLELTRCRIHLAAGGGQSAGTVDSLVLWTAEHGRVAMRQVDGTSRLTGSAGLPGQRIADARAIFLPLTVRGETLGVLELEFAGPVTLPPAQQRFLDALAGYAALAVERARLEAEAGRVEALREADRLKDALLASVSHDLRTPLTTIKALAHELARSDERAMIIEEEADRLNRLVADLLDLTRLKAGVLSFDLEIDAIDDLIGQVVQRTSGVLKSRVLAVTLEEGGSLLIGRFDLVQSARILVNLIENADKYAPAGTPIDLTARRAGDTIEITVADRGPGIAPDQAERIFEPFYRPPDTPPDVGGSGLGLAIARQLARAQAGDLTYSPRPNLGAAFTLTLPAADLPADSPPL